MDTEFWWENLRERGHFEHVGIARRIILKWVLRTGWEVID
jgi:hypothetical protein